MVKVRVKVRFRVQKDLGFDLDVSQSRLYGRHSKFLSQIGGSSEKKWDSWLFATISNLHYFVTETVLYVLDMDKIL